MVKAPRLRQAVRLSVRATSPSRRLVMARPRMRMLMKQNSGSPITVGNTVALMTERRSASLPRSPKNNSLNTTEMMTQAMVPNRVQRPTLDQLCRAVIVLEGNHVEQSLWLKWRGACGAIGAESGRSGGSGQAVKFSIDHAACIRATRSRPVFLAS